MRKPILICLAAALGASLLWLPQITERGNTTSAPQAIATESTPSASDRTAPKPSSKPATPPIHPTNEIAQALSSAFAEDQEYLRTATLIAALKQLDADTAHHFRAYFESQSLLRRDLSLWLIFLSAWADFDGMAAIQFVHQQFSDPNVRQQLYLPILKSWKNYAPAESVLFTATLVSEDSELDTGLAMSYLETLLAKDLNQALGLALKLNDDELVLELSGKQVARIAKQNIAEAYTHLESLPEGESRTFATAQYVRVWSESAPLAAADWVLTNFQQGIDPETLKILSVNYLQHSPEQAMDWAYRLPDALYSEALLITMVDEWTRRDQAAVQNWLAQFEPGEELDPVVQAHSMRIAQNSPAEALDQWIPQIKNQLNGQNLYYQVAIEWQKKDPAAFQAWLDAQTAMTSQFKQNLLEREFPFPSNDAATATAVATTPQALDNGRDR